MELKVVSFNLKGRVPLNSPYAWANRQKSITSCLNELHPDILGTQELTIREIADLKRLLPDYQWVGMGRRGGSRGEFTAIFYNARRLTCVVTDTFWLGNRPSVAGSRYWTAAYPRICTWGIFRDLNTAENIAVYNTHLDHLSPWARKQGIKQITDFITKMNTGYPTVFMGDFNAYPETRAMQHLKVINRQNHQFSNCSLDMYFGHRQIGRTYHAFKGIKNGRPIDYVFCSPDITIKKFLIDRNQYNSRYPSDHYPSVVLIETEKAGD